MAGSAGILWTYWFYSDTLIAMQSAVGWLFVAVLIFGIWRLVRAIKRTARNAASNRAEAFSSAVQDAVASGVASALAAAYADATALATGGSVNVHIGDNLARLIADNYDGIYDDNHRGDDDDDDRSAVLESPNGRGVRSLPNPARRREPASGRTVRTRFVDPARSRNTRTADDGR